MYISKDCKRRKNKMVELESTLRVQRTEVKLWETVLLTPMIKLRSILTMCKSM